MTAGDRVATSERAKALGRTASMGGVRERLMSLWRLTEPPEPEPVDSEVPGIPSTPADEAGGREVPEQLRRMADAATEEGQPARPPRAPSQDSAARQPPHRQTQDVVVPDPRSTRHKPGDETAPDDLLRVPASARRVADEFFGELIRRARGR